MKRPEDLTGPALKEIRQQRGMTQEEFWLPLSVTKQAGSNIEREYSKISSPVRLLAFLRYVLDLPLDDVAALRERIQGFQSIQDQLNELKEAVDRIRQGKGVKRG